MPAVLRVFLEDPRNLQIAVLALLTVYGALVLDFVLTPLAPVFAIGAALVVERALFRFRVGRSDPSRTSPPYKSALISALSSLLLYRSADPLAYAGVVAIALTSKVVLRFDGRHFVNPTNGGVLLGSLVLPGWIASGQWGHDTVLIFCLAAGSSLILFRAARIDSALAFLGGMLAFEVLRALVFGYRAEVVLHHFTSGALWLFALYMITDPKTTPMARSMRIVHALAVAVAAVSMAQFFYVRDAFLWSLLFLSPLVPLLDRAHQSLRSASITSSTPTPTSPDSWLIASRS
jgi:Na+-transporting NADH:ubiquinone oxidoreductase subunit NqrB